MRDGCEGMRTVGEGIIVCNAGVRDGYECVNDSEKKMKVSGMVLNA